MSNSTKYRQRNNKKRKAVQVIGQAHVNEKGGVVEIYP